MQQFPREHTSHHQETSLPPAREVVSNIWQIPLPAPLPLRSVNVYALLGQDGWALLDSGTPTRSARRVLYEELQRLGLRIEHLRTIVLSHHHPDHTGLFAELHQQSGAAVLMHPLDAVTLDIIREGKLHQRFEQISRFLAHHGIPASQRWSAQTNPTTPYDAIRVPPREAITLVEDGQQLDLVGASYRVVWTPGHADGHISLFRERDGVLLVADHVLPQTTPNVGLYSEQDPSNPLGNYFDALAKVAALPVSISLPGHGDPFHQLGERIQEIRQHHSQRFQSILTLLSQRPQHANELADTLFKDRLHDPDIRRLAVGEVLAHLSYLHQQGQVEPYHTKEGIIIYTLPSQNTQEATQIQLQ